MISKWDYRYLDLAKFFATWSKDPSKKIGAVAIGSRGQVLAQGYNGFPRGIEDHDWRLNDRPTKYKYVVHAEMNCIYNAGWNGVSLNGATLYVHGLPVCHECAKGIIQTGIVRVVAGYKHADEQWVESEEITKELLSEAGIEYVTAF